MTPYDTARAPLTRPAMSDLSHWTGLVKRRFARRLLGMNRAVSTLCIPLALLLLPACAESLKGAKEISHAAGEYQQAKADFDAFEAENAAKSARGWEEGVALHDEYMAAPAPAPAQTADEAKAWYEQRSAIITQTDAHFAHVQLHTDRERGYRTHMMLGDMERRLIDELHSFEATLSADDGRTMHAAGLTSLLESAIKHYNAWDGAYAEFDEDGELARTFATEIETAKTHRDTLELAWQRNGKIIMGDLSTKTE